jgi:hypothetical protein
MDDDEDLEPEDSEDSGDKICLVTCSRCGTVSSFPGFLAVALFACPGCGEMVEPLATIQ